MRPHHARPYRGGLLFALSIGVGGVLIAPGSPTIVHAVGPGGGGSTRTFRTATDAVRWADTYRRFFEDGSTITLRPGGLVR